jgi:hypothetical protein
MIATIRLAIPTTKLRQRGTGLAIAFSGTVLSHSRRIATVARIQRSVAVQLDRFLEL